MTEISGRSFDLQRDLQALLDLVSRARATDLVWGLSANPVAVHLYESAGFTSRRVLRDYRRTL